MNVVRVILVAILGVVVFHGLYRYTAHNEVRALRRVWWIWGLAILFVLGWHVCPELGPWAVVAAVATWRLWRWLGTVRAGWRLHLVRAATVAVCFWPLTFGISESALLRRVSSSFWDRILPPPPLVDADGREWAEAISAGSVPSVMDIVPHWPSLVPGLVWLGVAAGFVSWLRARVPAGERWPGLLAGRRRRVALGIVAALLLLGLNWWVAGWVEVYTEAQRGRVWAIRYAFWSRPGSQRWSGDDAYRGPPLLVACIARQTDALRTLLAAGADPNLRRWPEYLSPLSQAVAYSDVAMARLLLAAGADVNRRDSQGKTPLDDATDDTLRALLRAYGGKTGAELKPAPR